MANLNDHGCGALACCWQTPGGVHWRASDSDPESGCALNPRVRVALGTWWYNCSRYVVVRPSRGPASGIRLPRTDPTARGVTGKITRHWVVTQQARHRGLSIRMQRGTLGSRKGGFSALEVLSVLDGHAQSHTYRGCVRRERASRFCLVHSRPSQQPWCTRRST